jgi:hypothetical protein
MDELALAFGARPYLLGPQDFLLRNRDCRGHNRWVPKLVKIRHGHSPMCHGTPRILFGYAPKCAFSGGVSEGMKQSDPTVELTLNRWHARNRKRRFSQLLRCVVAMRLLGSYPRGKT